MNGIEALAQLTAQGEGGHDQAGAVGALGVLAGFGAGQHSVSAHQPVHATVVLAAARGVLKLVGVPDYRFPVVSRTLAQLLIAQRLAGAGQVGTETPSDLQSKLPFVRIDRVGGTSDLLNDYATTAIEVFATTSVASEQLAEYIRQYLVFADLPAIDGYGLIDRVECITGPAELPWSDNRVRRYGATYRVIARRRRIA